MKIPFNTTWKDVSGGHLLIDPAGQVRQDVGIFEEVSCFNEQGLAFAYRNKKWGVIDSNGHTVIPFIYDGAYDVLVGTIAILMDGETWGAINTSNHLIIPFLFPHIWLDDKVKAICFGTEEHEVQMRLILTQK